MIATTKKNQRRKRYIAAVYHAGSQAVLLPLRGWWLLHEASKPLAVCASAGLDFGSTWRAWERLARIHDLDWNAMRRWFYWHPLPVAERKRYIELGIIRKVGQVEWIAEDSMRQFRNFSNWRAIGEAARKMRTANEGTTVNSAIATVKRLPVRMPWFEAWIAEGEDPPAGANVRIVTAGELDSLHAAFDYAAEKRLRPYYARWFGGGRRNPLFPAKDGHELFLWVRFVYGGPIPDGWYRVSASDEKIRAAATPESKIAAARVGTRGHAARWLRKVLDEEVGGQASNRTYYSAKAQAERERVEKLSTIAAICRRAGVDQSVYYTAIKQAAALGPSVADDLKLFLRGEGGRRLAKLTGEIAPKVFRPPATLLQFQDASRARIRERKSHVWALAKLLPAFEKIVVDLAVPRVKNSTRSSYPWLTGFLQGNEPAPAPPEISLPAGAVDAPAGDGWHFVDNLGFYRAKKFYVVKGKALAVIRALVESPAPLTWLQLAAAAWPGEEPEHSTLRVTVGNARKFLKESLELSPDVDPLPHCGNRHMSAWKCHEALR